MLNQIVGLIGLFLALFFSLVIISRQMRGHTIKAGTFILASLGFVLMAFALGVFR